MTDVGIIHEVIQIPSGNYSIGDDSVPNAAPKHQRRLESSVWLLDRPVTWELFEAILEAGGFPHAADFESATTGDYRAVSVDKTINELLDFSIEMERELPWRQCQASKLPVTGLNWFAASALANFIGARLPAEIEWELAMKFVGKKRGMISQAFDFSGCLEEWTSDSFAPKYWRADFSKRGVPWKPGASQEVTIRGSVPDALYKHICFRRGCDPASSHRRRGFRFAWDRLPAGSRIVN